MRATAPTGPKTPTAAELSAHRAALDDRISGLQTEFETTQAAAVRSVLDPAQYDAHKAKLSDLQARIAAEQDRLRHVTTALSLASEQELSEIVDKFDSLIRASQQDFRSHQITKTVKKYEAELCATVISSACHDRYHALEAVIHGMSAVRDSVKPGLKREAFRLHDLYRQRFKLQITLFESPDAGRAELASSVLRWLSNPVSGLGGGPGEAYMEDYRRMLIDAQENERPLHEELESINREIRALEATLLSA